MVNLIYHHMFHTIFTNLKYSSQANNINYALLVTYDNIVNHQYSLICIDLLYNKSVMNEITTVKMQR